MRSGEAIQVVCRVSENRCNIWLPLNRILEILQTMIVPQKVFMRLPFLVKRLSNGEYKG